MSKKNREQSRTARAAAIQKQHKRQENFRRYGIVGISALIALGLIAAGVWLGTGNTPGALADSDLPALRVDNTALIMGDDDADMQVVIYEDFQCPFCRELEVETQKMLLDAANDGVAQVEYRPFNLLQSMPYSGLALSAWAAALENDTPQNAYRVHAALFDNQPYEQNSAATTVDDVKRWVKKAGADEDIVAAGMEDPDEEFFDEAMDAAVEAIGERLGTPTVFVNGNQLTGNSITDIANKLKAAIEASK